MYYSGSRHWAGIINDFKNSSALSLLRKRKIDHGMIGSVVGL